MASTEDSPPKIRSLYDRILDDEAYTFHYGLPSSPLIESGRLSVCNLVRTTSWGYVTMDAVIFAMAEQTRICSACKGSVRRRAELGKRL